MKKRSGFVSNSSSSSFVVLGIDTRIDDELIERIQNGDLEEEYIYDSDAEIAGYRLGRVGEGDQIVVELNEIMDLIPTVSEDLGVEPSALKIIAWEMPS